MLAISWGGEAVVKLLLEKGADVEAKDCCGFTSLVIAEICGFHSILKLLKRDFSV
jgi:hypothetical protein